VDAVGLACAAEANKSFSTCQADHFCHESGLAHACFCHDADDLTFAFHRQIQPVVDDLQLFLSSNHRQGVVRLLQTDGTLLAFTRHSEHG